MATGPGSRTRRSHLGSGVGGIPVQRHARPATGPHQRRWCAPCPARPSSFPLPPSRTASPSSAYRTAHSGWSVDRLPDRAGIWYTKHLSFKDRPANQFTIRHRDPKAVLASLMGDPALAEHLVYRPRKIFTNQDKDMRIYSEMWTGKWWHAAQVSHCSLPTRLSMLICIILGVLATLFSLPSKTS